MRRDTTRSASEVSRKKPPRRAREKRRQDAAPIRARSLTRSVRTRARFWGRRDLPLRAQMSPRTACLSSLLGCPCTTSQRRPGVQHAPRRRRNAENKPAPAPSALPRAHPKQHGRPESPAPAPPHKPQGETPGERHIHPRCTRLSRRRSPGCHAAFRALRTPYRCG